MATLNGIQLEMKVSNFIIDPIELKKKFKIDYKYSNNGFISPEAIFFPVKSIHHVEFARNILTEMGAIEDFKMASANRGWNEPDFLIVKYGWIAIRDLHFIYYKTNYKQRKKLDVYLDDNKELVKCDEKTIRESLHRHHNDRLTQNERWELNNWSFCAGNSQPPTEDEIIARRQHFAHWT
jgi:hypothetical protein